VGFEPGVTERVGDEKKGNDDTAVTVSTKRFVDIR